MGANPRGQSMGEDKEERGGEGDGRGRGREEVRKGWGWDKEQVPQPDFSK